ncbi:MAG: FAD-binding oxidoreductase [Pseudomonadota bacterium]
MAVKAHTKTYSSWGGVLRAPHEALLPTARDAAAMALSAPVPNGVVAYGNGRSYGDVALNPHGGLVDMRGLDRFIAFDRRTGLITCEAGVTLADILDVAARPEADGSGWLLPVMPGTRFITVGGAIANDVHGKNAHHLGSFGGHVEALELARSDGRRLTCSRAENAALFHATIGGLGLTGLILSATLRLRRVAGLGVESEDIRFDHLDAFFDLDVESAGTWEYTAAWIDCLAQGAALGRGIYSRSRHVAGVAAAPPARHPRLSVPLAPPVSAVNGLSVRAFNALYWRKLGGTGRRLSLGSYEPAFFPLDAIGHWNRLYGPKGFFQFQAAVPPEDAKAVTTALLSAIAASGQGSMLVVLKRFGEVASEGLLSFPMPGISLALDFPNRGASTTTLLARLEAIVMEAGGRIYPAKDFCMSAASFAAGYPGLDAFRHHLDPAMTSAFARRVGIVREDNP